jgi:hypothetical protein
MSGGRVKWVLPFSSRIGWLNHPKCLVLPEWGRAPSTSRVNLERPEAEPRTNELSKITPVMVRSWYADLAAQTPGVARSSYRLLKAIFNTAITDDLILKNPRRVKGGGTDWVTERRIPDVNQVAALTQTMPEQYQAAVIVGPGERSAGARSSGSSAGMSTSSPGPSGSSGHCTSSTTVPSTSGRPRTATPERSTCRARSCQRSKTPASFCRP